MAVVFFPLVVLLIRYTRSCSMWKMIPLDKENRMIRQGFGLHEGKWFLRIDLWFVGFRLTKKEPEKNTPR